jgi:hypothetical protein
LGEELGYGFVLHFEEVRSGSCVVVVVVVGGVVS